MTSAFGGGARTYWSCWDDNRKSTATLTAVCATEHRSMDFQGGVRRDLNNEVVTIDGEHNPTFVSLTHTDFNNICVWVRPEELGTLFYAAEEGLSPYFALYDNLTSGVFLTPDTSASAFDTSRLYDGTWHQICVTLHVAVPHLASTVCQLYIDGFLEVETSSGRNCTMEGKSGHFVIGSSDAFVPIVTYRNGTSSMVEHVRSEDEKRDQEVFPLPQFVGSLGFIYGSRDLMSASDIENLAFNCGGSDNIFASQSFNVFGFVTRLWNIDPCFEYSNQFTVDININFDQADRDIDVIISFEPVNADMLQSIGVETLSLNVSYDLVIKEEKSTAQFISSASFPLSQEQTKIKKTLSNPEYSALYRFQAVVNSGNLETHHTRELSVTRDYHSKPDIVTNLGPILEDKPVVGSDVISWTPSLNGNSDEFIVKLYHVDDVTRTLLSEENVGEFTAYVIDASSSDHLVPGQPYLVEVSGRYHGVEGAPVYYRGNTQPTPPVITNVRALSTRIFGEVSMAVVWEQNHPQFSSFYVITAVKKDDGSSISHEFHSSVTSFQLDKLEPETNYTVTVTCHFGDKYSESEPYYVTTGSSVKYFFGVERVDHQTVLFRWEVFPTCERYLLGADAISPINDAFDQSQCDDVGAIEPVIVYCNQYIREFSMTMATNVTLPQTGCRYRFSVSHYASDELIEPNFELISYFLNPKPISPVTGLILLSSSSNHLEFGWDRPDPAELVDRYQVSLTECGSSFPTLSSVLSNSLKYTASNLVGGTLYTFSIICLHEYLASDVISLDVRSNFSDFGSNRNCCDETPERTEVSCLEDFSQSREENKKNSERSVVVYDVTMTPPHIKWTSLNITEQVDLLSCSGHLCADPGIWSPWSAFRPCTRSCGNGTLHLTRSCLPRSSSKIAPVCEGSEEKEAPCGNDPCPVDGEWGGWSSWEPCIVLCGIRNSTRTRSCDLPAPTYGGKSCPTSHCGQALKETEVKKCEGRDPCPGDYFWGNWFPFSACHVTCGESAKRARERRCEWTQKEYLNSHECPEVETEVFRCGPTRCPQHGVWGTWAAWTPCSVSCGGGVQFRARMCDDPPPSLHGDPCEGLRYQQRECTRRVCPQNRYHRSESSIPQCPGVISSDTRLRWEPGYTGSTQNQSCPVGTVGMAYRKCSQNRKWLSEELFDCVIPPISKVLKYLESSIPGKVAFKEIETSVNNIFLRNVAESQLQTHGDLNAIEKILKELLVWNPFLFEDASRSERLDFINLFTSSMEQLLRPDHSHLWSGMNISTLQRSLKQLLSILDDASLGAMSNLESGSYANYRTATSPDLNMLLVAKSGWREIVKYPQHGDPEYSKDGSFVEIPSNVIETPDNNTVQLSLLKFNNNFDLMTSLPTTSLVNGAPSFDGRTLNSALIGVQMLVDGKLRHHLDNPIYVTFYHKRESRNPLCVFVDLHSQVGVFNDDGCKVFKIRRNSTVCECRHLTTFALLSHDVIDDDVRQGLVMTNFISLVENVGYLSIAILLLALALVSFAQTSTTRLTFLSFNVIVAALLRHAMMQVIFHFWTSNTMTCAIVALCLSYACAVCCVWHAFRMIDVISQAKNVNQKEFRSSYNMVGWGLTIMTATSPLLVQLLYDYEEQEYHLSCEEIFSFEVTLPSWTCCVIISVVSFLLFIHAVMFFNKVQEKLNPAHALRLETLIWLFGFSCLFNTLSVGASFSILYRLSLPMETVQIVYCAAIAIEAIFAMISEVWLNKEIRGFYYKRLGRKPPIDEVVYQPPKYIP
ncbi:unnamed protein product [Clavelina lepadiformis]|uniref:Uncharacterized protein n=1 Tax=Clavelina lepadiformis TaxID=159417 RepID=A0ABP0F649_CLALP